MKNGVPSAVISHWFIGATSIASGAQTMVLPINLSPLHSLAMLDWTLAEHVL
jgi:hypothetical protein